MSFKIKFKALISLKSFKSCETILNNKNKVGGFECLKNREYQNAE